MTVQELIDQLSEIKDKTRQVRLSVGYGRGDVAMTDEHITTYEDEGCVFISGDEDEDLDD